MPPRWPRQRTICRYCIFGQYRQKEPPVAARRRGLVSLSCYLYFVLPELAGSSQPLCQPLFALRPLPLCFFSSSAVAPADPDCRVCEFASAVVELWLDALPVPDCWVCWLPVPTALWFCVPSCVVVVAVFDEPCCWVCVEVLSLPETCELWLPEPICELDWSPRWWML